MLHKIIKTGDGSHSLFVEQLNEHYHSIHGAIQESKHVFIEAGLKHAISFFSGEKSNGPYTILEIGLGTGLNVLLTILENQQLHCDLIYTAIEANPLPPETVSHLNYTDLLADQTHSKAKLDMLFEHIHSCQWNKIVEITPQLKLNKIENTLQNIQFQDAYDLVYFDAFGPVVQPEMWTEHTFKKIHDAMNEGGVLVTYCAKGIVKRTLKAIGFKIETLQGPPGKREMVRAIKTT